MKQRYVSRADTVLLKLPIEVLQSMRGRSKVLDSILTDQAKKFPECDFNTYLTYKNKLTPKQLQTKFKRAVRRQVQLKRYKNSMNTLLNIAFFKEQGMSQYDNLDGDFNNREVDFFGGDDDIKAMELTQRAQRILECKIFNLLTKEDILEDIEIISA